MVSLHVAWSRALADCLGAETLRLQFLLPHANHGVGRTVRLGLRSTVCVSCLSISLAFADTGLCIHTRTVRIWPSLKMLTGRPAPLSKVPATISG